MFIGILFITKNTPAQNYQTSGSVKIRGLTGSLIVKQFVSNTSALENVMEIAFEPLFTNRESNFYTDNRWYTNLAFSAPTGISSMNYIFKNVQLSEGPDFKPFIDLFNGNTIYFDGV